MRYTIQNILHRSSDLDDHIIHFEFEVHFTEPEEMIVNYFYGYSLLSGYINKNHPEFYAYLKKVQKSIDGWGPQEHRVMEEIGEEALQQLYAYLEEYLLQADWLPKLFEREKERLSQTEQQQIKTHRTAEKIVKELGALESPMKTAQKNYLKFCETVEKQIRQTAAEVFPELVDGDAEQLEEFRYLFVRDIQSMHERIEKMLMKYREKNK